LGFAASAWAAEGQLDPSFGTGGKVTTPLGTGDSEATSAVIDSQGRIVVAGTSLVASDNDFSVARYLPNGTLDTTFNALGAQPGVPGTATYDFAATGDQDIGSCVAIDSQGRIVIGGESSLGGGSGSNDFALLRINPDGSRDGTFGTNTGSHKGEVTTPIGTLDDDLNGIAVDSQNRIVAVGSAYDGSTVNFGVARYRSDGSLDTSFGPGGTGKFQTQIGASQDVATGVAIDAQGQIVVAGNTAVPGGSDFGVVRYNGNDGSLDTSFNGTGKVRFPVGSQGGDFGTDLAIDGQGKIVVVGNSAAGAGGQDFGVARLNSTGTLDTSFNGTGTVTTPIGFKDDFPEAVAIDSQDRIVVGGNSLDGTQTDFAVVRYQPGGTLDPAFNGSGKVTTPIGTSNDQANAIAIDGQDRVLAAGTAAIGSDDEFALARYIGDQTAPIATIGTGPAAGAYTNDPTPTFTFSSSEAGSTFTCGFDGAKGPCASPQTPAATLADGAHAFSLIATDRAGNASVAVTRTFNVDTHKPELKIKGKAKVKTAGRKGRDKLRLKANEPVTFRCKVDRKKARSCKARYKTPKLKLGKHKLKVVATDRAGNKTSKTKKLKVVRKR
jgi:uncharacterized delta-60 repeat protein